MKHISSIINIDYFAWICVNETPQMVTSTNTISVLIHVVYTFPADWCDTI